MKLLHMSLLIIDNVARNPQIVPNSILNYQVLDLIFNPKYPKKHEYALTITNVTTSG